MSKKNKLIITVGLFIILALATLIVISSTSGRYKIYIYNNTSQTIKNLEIKFATGEESNSIQEIESKKSWEMNFDTNVIKGESTIVITYKDNQGTLYEEYIAGYLEKGYSGNVKVNINTIDENCKLEMDVK